jgi:hypothetical protein
MVRILTALVSAAIVALVAPAAYAAGELGMTTPSGRS